MKALIKKFNSLINQLQILFTKEELYPIKTGIQIYANILFSDLKKNDSIILYITENTLRVYKGFSSSAGLSLIGPSTVWIEILTGQKSLSTSFAEGSIKVPNLRVNWSKLWLLSNLIMSVNDFKLNLKKESIL